MPIEECKIFLELQNNKAYLKSAELSNDIWAEILKTSYYTKDTVGKQLVRAVDSISANIAEAFGRYFYKEKLRFFYYARGSAIESIVWLNKIKERRLVNDKQKLNSYIKNLNEIIYWVNILIKYTRIKSKEQ